MRLDTIHELYRYHWWANRRLYDVAAALGPDLADREVGRQFSAPTLKGLLAHLYGADWIWLQRWQGRSPDRLPGGADFAGLAELREAWERVEAGQGAFLAALAPADLDRAVDYRTTDGRPFRAPLWVLLLHVPNHATHHRSEIATMLTMLSGPPPDTGLLTYHLLRTGQAAGTPAPGPPLR